MKTYMQELSELIVADLAFLVHTKMEVHEIRTEVEREVFVDSRVLNNVRKLI